MIEVLSEKISAIPDKVQACEKGHAHFSFPLCSLLKKICWASAECGCGLPRFVFFIPAQGKGGNEVFGVKGSR